MPVVLQAGGGHSGQPRSDRLGSGEPDLFDLLSPATHGSDSLHYRLLVSLAPPPLPRPAHTPPPRQPRVSVGQCPRVARGCAGRGARGWGHTVTYKGLDPPRSLLAPTHAWNQTKVGVNSASSPQPLIKFTHGMFLSISLPVYF